MHFQQALRFEHHHFTLSMQSSTVGWFKSEAGWNDLWGCLLSSIAYRKSFIQPCPSLEHPWCSGWRGRSGFQLKSLGTCRSGTAQVRQPQCTTTLHCSRAGWLSSCWHEQWWPTTPQLATGFHTWERQVLQPTIFISHWIPRAAGAKSCTLHKSKRAVARQQFLTARNGGKWMLTSQPVRSRGIGFSKVSSQFSQWCGC